MPNLDAWVAFRDETALPVLIDAAAAFDVARDARLPTAVSLHATKALGVGEGGFLATCDKAFAARVRQMTSFGFKGSREAAIIATNAKLSEYAAAVGLAALDAWPADRLRFCFSAQLLRAALAMTSAVKFQAGWGTEWASSVCVVGLPDGAADAAAAALAVAGVDTRRWWGAGCHASAAFAGYPRADLTVTERLARSSLGLPFAIDLAPQEIDRIADALARAVEAPE
jgi:dTDP-4-amino-4,6-dideoxygalactose transaminase